MDAGMPGVRLRGQQILLARPAGQSESLCAALRAEGARVLLFPGLQILPCEPSAETRRCLDRLGEADWAVFVSTNAVAYGLVAAAQRGRWPERVRTAAVGAATARALEAAGLGPVLRPETREDSEGLLAAPGWGALAGRRVVIFRGEGGRETLARGLRAAGAEVCYAEIYRRAPPTEDPAPVRIELAAARIAVICAMSNATVDNLFDVFGDSAHEALRAVPWLLPHPRVAAAARALGIARVLESAGSGDEAILATLTDHFQAASP
jgi:uroporphyrinogen-III synthase